MIRLIIFHFFIWTVITDVLTMLIHQAILLKTSAFFCMYVTLGKNFTLKKLKTEVSFSQIVCNLYQNYLHY